MSDKLPHVEPNSVRIPTISAAEAQKLVSRQERIHMEIWNRISLVKVMSALVAPE